MSLPAALFCILISILLQVYAQLVLKHAIEQRLPLPEGLRARAYFFLEMLADIKVLSAMACGFIIVLFWSAALSRLPLSIAYPLMALSYPAVLVGSWFFFGDSLSVQKMLGISLIIVGVSVANLESWH